MTTNDLGSELVAHREMQAREQRRLVLTRWRGKTADDVIAALRLWAKLHDGRAPSSQDWSARRDSDHVWPRYEFTSRMFRPLAIEAGVRIAGSELCQAQWHYTTPDPGEAWCRCATDEGLSGWAWALWLADLTVRQGSDSFDTPRTKERLGRNRQMVTGGRAHAKTRRGMPSRASSG